jgi:prepilin-type N-terminal cleavage/methylation domain-containing protein
MKNCQNSGRKGFTLLEVLVAIAVFALIVTAAAGTFAAIQTAWRKQRNTIDLAQNARWAMEFMANEIRQGGAPIAISGGSQRISFRPYPGPLTPLVWYWRGNGGALGTSSIMYRGTGANIAAANAARQELANFIVFPNPSGNAIFINPAAGLYTIELTVRPRPAAAAGQENRDYTLRTQVRVRN